MQRTSITLTIAAIASLSFASLAYAEQPGAHFVENWDLDENGVVSLADMTERRDDIFTTFDENDDGFITAQEYVAFDEARAADMENEKGGHLGGNGKRAQVGMTMAFNDVDGDGKVSRAEFVGQTAAWLAKMDRNGDGAVTTADFGRGN